MEAGAEEDDRATDEGSIERNSSDDEENTAERSGQSMDVDSDEQDRMRRHRVRIDVAHRLCGGSLLPAALLIDSDLMSPHQVVDP